MDKKNNNTKEYSKFIVEVIVTTLITLLAVGIFNAVLDPFYHYHGPLINEEPYMYTAIYQTCGAAKNFKYDVAIVGTSMTENFRSSWFEEQNLHCEKFSYPSATLKDCAMILDSVFESNNEVKYVLMDLSDSKLNEEVGSILTDEAYYLNDKDWLDDYNYLLNMDVTRQSLFRLEEALTHTSTNHDDDYTWEDPSYFSAGACMADTYYSRCDILYQKENNCFTPFDTTTISPYEYNLGEITPYIEAHPETTFYFYLPPFSVLYWELQNMEGRMDWILEVYEGTVSVLSAYDNVEVLSFVADEWIIEDLNLYRDSGHYSPAINRYIYDSVMDGSHRVNKDTFHEEALFLKELIGEYDFETLWLQWNP